MRAKLSQPTSTVGMGGRGGGPFLPQLTPQQEVGKSWDEAGRVAGILEIKIMMIAYLLST